MRSGTEISTYLDENPQGINLLGPYGDIHHESVRQEYLVEVININSEKSVSVVIESVGLENTTTFYDAKSEIGSFVVNNDSLVLGQKYAQVCLQPHVVNCRYSSEYSPLLRFDSEVYYQIDLNGVKAIVKGSDLRQYFIANNFELIAPVE